VKKNEELIIDITDMEFNGYGISYIDNKKVKVKGCSITGQKVTARIKRIKGCVIEADLLDIIEKSPLEHENVCQYFGKCGGCTYLNMYYKDQLKMKENIVKKLLDNAGIEGYEYMGIEGSPKEFAYRNKMEYTFGKEKNGKLALGLHKRGRFNEIITTENCLIVDKDFIKLLKSVLNYAIENKLPVYEGKKREGYLRHLVIRKALKSGEILVNIVTTTEILHDFTPLTGILKNLDYKGKLVGILHTLNDSLSDAVVCDKLEILYGRDYFIEELLELKFRISAFSFFQTNPYGAERLYSTAREFAGDISDKVVFDLYCGTGTISIIMAPLAKSVIGIELVSEAVEAAKENAELNGLKNCTFIAGDVVQKLKEINEKPDVVILDPPRAGVNPKAIIDIIKFNPETIVYVSCNPESLARDLKMLCGRQYKVEKVKCVDMFPHTYHVETVVKLQRKHS
jgi:23S rRNA (uracil1939-C5)-methyltransferase